MTEQSSGGRESIESTTSLLHVVEAGLTTPLAIAIATGIGELSAVAPTDDQREILGGLLRNYRAAIRIVNSETMKERL